MGDVYDGLRLRIQDNHTLVKVMSSDKPLCIYASKYFTTMIALLVIVLRQAIASNECLHHRTTSSILSEDDNYRNVGQKN
ncbi:hypothetical protein I8751_20105 [Nostocaceae cyanobacterium CENA357]|uniref:Uncharacterized protein n=1 Tax=Atlanticothrix silvestris CENA357 TaxID=1725252 RepID=A0A8J7HLW5_9CYAN|nr:hypothetical protein [Atlanticothrix silvestris]MBH8554620.1 hypothetical protein [Atlanticothrix silvestris CENA357]